MEKYDLKWGWPELHSDGIVTICSLARRTGYWLTISQKEAAEKYGCPQSDYTVYRAIIQRWHDLMEKEKPVQFKAGDYMRGKYPDAGGWVYYVSSTGKETSQALNTLGQTLTITNEYLEPATPAEAQEFRRQLAENLGLKKGIEIEYRLFKEKITHIDYENGKIIFAPLLNVEIPIQEWTEIKVIEPKAEKPKFDLWDWVKHEKYGRGQIICFGQVSGNPGVEFEREIFGGHYCAGRKQDEGRIGKNGHCSFCEPKDLTYCDPPMPKSETPFQDLLRNDPKQHRRIDWDFAKLLDEKFKEGD